MGEQFIEVFSDDFALHPGIGRAIFLVAIDQTVAAVEERHHGRDILESQRQSLQRAFALGLGGGDFGHVETGAAIACQFRLGIEERFARHVDLPCPPLAQGQDQPQITKGFSRGEALL